MTLNNIFPFLTVGYIKKGEKCLFRAFFSLLKLLYGKLLMKFF